MKISLEAEAMPIFIGSVLLVFLLELGFSLLILRRHTGGQRMMVGHIICLLIAFFCLGFLLFLPQPTPDGDVQNSSMLFAVFGFCWFLGELFSICAVCAVLMERKKAEKQDQKKIEKPVQEVQPEASVEKL